MDPYSRKQRWKLLMALVAMGVVVGCHKNDEEPVRYGCTSSSYPNYDPAANIDDGSCCSEVYDDSEWREFSLYDSTPGSPHFGLRFDLLMVKFYADLQGPCAGHPPPAQVEVCGGDTTFTAEYQSASDPVCHTTLFHSAQMCGGMSPHDSLSAYAEVHLPLAFEPVELGITMPATFVLEPDGIGGLQGKRTLWLPCSYALGSARLSLNGPVVYLP